MSVVLEIGLDVGFQLDDPVRGVLDDPDFPIEGINFVDITNRLDEMNVSRGKNRELDRFNAGTLSARLKNEDRAFDPLYTASPFYGDIVPRRRVRFSVDGAQQYEGVIDDWNFDYAPGGESRAELNATDAFTFFATQFLTPGTATPQLTGARVSEVLDMPTVDWDASKRNIDTGVSFLGADVFEGNVFDYLNKIATSDAGIIFIGKNGDVVFRDRYDATPTSTNVTEFADDGTGIPYTLTQVNYGTELLVNQATFTSLAGTATTTNAESAAEYGISATEIDTLVDSVAQLQNLADFTVAKFGEPEYRFGQIQVNLDKLTAQQKADVLGLEIGDVTSIRFTPNNIPPAIVQLGQIIRVDHSVTKERHDVTFSLASVDFTFLVLDDAEFGRMDAGNLLAF